MPCISYPFDFKATREDRVDVLLVEYFKNTGVPLSRSLIKQAFINSDISIDGKAIQKLGVHVEEGTRIHGSIVSVRQDDLSPYPMDIPIVYEDESLLVVNKPANLPVHPGANTGNRTLINALLPYVRDIEVDEDTIQRPGIVHRLDRDTTGLLVIARTRDVHADLARQFQERSIERVYDTLVVATPRQKRAIQRKDEGVIKTHIARDPHRRTRFAVCEKGGKLAETAWSCVERFYYGARLHVRLKTGRTHQIRVHMAHIGSPVFGDRVYGSDVLLPAPLQECAKQFGRQALHARVLGFVHPMSKKAMRFEAELPDDHQAALKTLSDYGAS